MYVGTTPALEMLQNVSYTEKSVTRDKTISEPTTGKSDFRPASRQNTLEMDWISALSPATQPVSTASNESNNEHTSEGACAMCFYIQSFARIEAGFGIDRTCQRLLCIGVRHEDARSLAVVIDPRVQDDRMDGVAVGQGAIKALENKNSNTLTSPITSATIIEGIASSVFVDECARLEG
jgi:hypothetical protein